LADGDTEAMTVRRAVILAHYPPIHGSSAYRSDVALPLTEEYAGRAVTLPLFPGIGEEQIELVVRSLQEALDRD
jgi:dTDP-4-amino-4,6-dideoxygalactose transaminase